MKLREATKLGDRLRSLMQSKNVTSDQMGSAAGIDPGTVNQILNGDIERPPDQRLRGFARILEVSFESLLDLIPERLRESVSVTEADGVLIEAMDGDAPGRRWRIRVIHAGLSGNGTFYGDAVLRESVGLFEGARVLARSDADHISGAGKDVRNIVGQLSNVRFVEGGGQDGGEIQADFEVLDPNGEIGKKLREAWDKKMTGLFGFSIAATGKTRRGNLGGRSVRIAESIIKVESVDLVVEPSAGGEVLKLIESQRKDTAMTVFLTQDQIAHTVTASGLPKVVQDRVLGDHAAPSRVTESELREAIDNERAYAARLSESGRVIGMGDTAPRIELIESQADKVNGMLDAFFDPRDSSVVSIKACYVHCTGDDGITGDLRQCDRSRLRESLESGTFSSVLGDSIARRMIADYRLPNVFGVWRNIVNIVPVQDFRSQERTRFGGYGALPIVAQSAPYTLLTSPTDEKATYTVAKRGGTEDVTIEMIANDDAGAVQRVPIKLSRSAARTVSKFVFDLIKDNGVIFDSLALFHATHNNLGTAALSKTSLAARRLAMKRQTELNSGERLGIGPRWLVVPDDLEETAVDLFRRNTENDKNFVQSLTVGIIPVWYWTDSNDWYLAADPVDIPSIEVGFFNGNEEPELFVQDDPKQGSVFSHDKITYKIRHIYGAAATDFRGLDGSVVA